MLKKNCSPQDPLKDEEKYLISYNLKHELNDDSFALKDFDGIGDSINNKSIDLFTQQKTQVKRSKFFKCPECDKRCSTSRHLKAHHKKIHEKLKTKRVFKSVPVLLQCG